MTRREVLQAALATTAAAAGGAAAQVPQAGPHVAVVGAGAFGGWTALQLARLGE